MDDDEYQPSTEDYWQECVRLRLLRVASWRCGGSVEPEDMVHEAFVRGAEASCLATKCLQPFLVTVIRRLCVDEARRGAVAGRVATHPRLLPAAAEDPAEVACDRAEARWLATRLTNSSPNDRRLLSMLTAGFSLKDIAEKLGTTPQ
jgi:DNA-directed RNA polymerase specialized sigma24 family protein